MSPASSPPKPSSAPLSSIGPTASPNRIERQKKARKYYGHNVWRCSMSVAIDPRAIVDAKAQLDENVSIGPYSVVEEDVVIGKGSVIASNALIASGARLGKECRVHHGAVVGSIPQDLKFHGEKSLLEVGDHTVIREFATLNRGTAAKGKT